MVRINAALKRNIWTLREPLLEIAKAHRINTELRNLGIRVNRKLVATLHTCRELPFMKRIKRPKASSLAKLLKETGLRTNLVVQLSFIGDFEVLYTDFTEILYRRGAGES